jgi:alpha-aminoadipate carrier protein LysW
MNSTCTECGGTLTLPEDVLVGEIVSCPDCGNEFEVKEKKEAEVTLVPAPKVEEDWGE